MRRRLLTNTGSTPDVTPYLRVMPAGAVWVDVGMPSDFAVYSNTDWKVE